MEEVNIAGVLYISSKRASEMSGYSQDYIGQLARGGAIDAKRLSGLWYISPDSLKSHKEKADAYVPQPPKKVREEAHMPDSTISLDGRSYISSSRAAKLSGYHSDYVTQLAREGKVDSKQVGKRWYVDQEAILTHKKEKDALLAAVQSESVGLKRGEEVNPSEVLDEGENLAPIQYFKEEERDLIPRIENSPQNIDNPALTEEDSVPADQDTRDVPVMSQNIPITIVRTVSPRNRAASVRGTYQESKSAGFRRKMVFPVLSSSLLVLLVAYVLVSGVISFEVVAQYASAGEAVDVLGTTLEELLVPKTTFQR